MSLLDTDLVSGTYSFSVKISAIIPARGGSKGIPRKNLLYVGGHPLVGHAIRAALSSGVVDRVVVSTDDAEIASVARRYGAGVVMRPTEISGDLASSESALLHVLKEWERCDYIPDHLLFLQCTSPFTRGEDIRGLVEHYLSEGADSAFTGVVTHRYLWREQSDGNWEGVNHSKMVRERRQERVREIMENGAAYVFKAAGFLKHQHRFFGKTVCWELPEEHGFEIDEPLDVTVVTTVAEAMQQAELASQLPVNVEAVVFDFDGVFTNNRVSLSQSGEESVTCSRGDGLALSKFKKYFPGKLLVLSTETNPVVTRRCEKLGIECLHGVSPKVAAMREWLELHAICADNVVFVGNDLNDIETMQLVGCAVAVADARPEAKACANIVLSKDGGEDAVRELLNLFSAQLKQNF